MTSTILLSQERSTPEMQFPSEALSKLRIALRVKSVTDKFVSNASISRGVSSTLPKLQKRKLTFVNVVLELEKMSVKTFQTTIGRLSKIKLIKAPVL
jgi:hypothetical protein